MRALATNKIRLVRAQALRDGLSALTAEFYVPVPVFAAYALFGFRCHKYFQTPHHQYKIFQYNPVCVGGVI